MIQQGQAFKLRAKGADGQPLWAYRYRLEGRGSVRPQVGGFATQAEALKALRKVLDRLGPGGGAATITLGELVEEYLEMHQAEQVTIAKLRWLLARRRLRGRRRLRAARVRERQTQAHEDPVEHPRSSAAGEGARGARPPAAVGEPDSVSERARRPDRLPRLRPPSLEASTDRGRHRAAARSLRHAPHLRHLRVARRRLGVRGLAVHRLKHRDDRLPLRSPRPRQPRTCRLAA
jgi:hypothetical protein